MKQCPKCNSMVDDSIVRCTVCGNIFPVNQEAYVTPVTPVTPVVGVDSYNQTVVTPVQPVYQTENTQQSQGNGANLVIKYTSTYPQVLMVTRIASTGQRNVYSSGQCFGYNLAPGEYVIVLKIGNINYNRKVFIPADGNVVTIYGSYDGRAHIDIDQPAYSPVRPNTDNYVMAPQNGYAPNVPQVNAGPVLKKNGPGIAGMVCGIVSLCCCAVPVLDVILALIALGLSIGGLCIFKKRRGSGTAIAGLVTSVITLIIVAAIAETIYAFMV